MGKIEIVIDSPESNEINGSTRNNSDDSIYSSVSVEETDDINIGNTKIVRGSAKNKSKIWGKMKKTLKPKKLLSSGNSGSDKSTTEEPKADEALATIDQGTIHNINPSATNRDFKCS